MDQYFWLVWPCVFGPLHVHMRWDIKWLIWSAMHFSEDGTLLSRRPSSLPSGCLSHQQWILGFWASTQTFQTVCISPHLPCATPKIGIARSIASAISQQAKNAITMPTSVQDYWDSNEKPSKTWRERISKAEGSERHPKIKKLRDLMCVSVSVWCSTSCRVTITEQRASTLSPKFTMSVETR